MGGPQGGGGGFFEMVVQGHKVGLIIGKGGETIKHLQVQTLIAVLLIACGPSCMPTNIYICTKNVFAVYTL